MADFLESQDNSLLANAGAIDPGIPGLVLDAGRWVKATFTVRLGRDFETYKEVLEYSLADEIFGSTNGDPSIDAGTQQIIDQLSGGGDDVAGPRQMMDAKFRDTSLGGNDAINCYYQFCENDDIIHPFNSLGKPDGKTGMGRVYSESIDDAQQIMYMTFGVPDFAGVTDFYKDAISGELANLMNGGDFFSVKNMGRLVGSVAGTVLTLPFLPIILLKKLGNLIPDLAKTKVTKYYDLKSTMPLYYKCVNSILAHLAVNMGFVMPDNDKESAAQGNSNLDRSKSTGVDQSYDELYKGEGDNERNSSSMPMVFQKKGWDIYSIICRKYLYNNLGHEENPANIDDLVQRYLQEASPGDTSFWDAYLKGAGAGVREAMTYVGFRIEKSVDNNESVSNSTGESELAQTLNSHTQRAKEAKFSLAGGTTGVDVIDGVLSGFKGIIEGTMEAVGVDGIGKALTGSGRIDIPDVWKDSSFTKTYSFNMALRSPYGDPVSIMQSIYIPLAMLLAGALPRAVGKNSYTSPFLISAYSKGMFGIPLGIIDSMNIRRGAEQHGWNYQGLPTAIDVSFTIKDLSPAMYMALADGSNWSDIFGQNSTFQEYLLTLSGVGMAERLLWTRNMKRRWQLIKQTVRHQKLNPVAWGFNSTQTRIGRAITACWPTVDLGSVSE